MNIVVSPKLLRLFLYVLQVRYWVAGIYLVLALAGIYGASRIPTDTAIERLVVAGDPVAQATLEFERVFPEGEQALLMLEAPDPLSQAVLQGAEQLERQLGRIPKVEAHSLLTLFRRADSSADISAEDAARIRTFATGTSLFRRAGLLGEHYFGIALDLRVSSPAERDRALGAIDALVLPLENGGQSAALPFSAIRRVGHPWLDAWLERQTGSATKKFMPLFGIFLLTLVAIVYRSWRTLAAIILTLGAVMAMAVGLGDVFGWSKKICP